MFGNRDKEAKTESQAASPKRPAAKPASHTVLGKGARFVGDLNIEGTVEVHGEVEGTITCTETLIVGKSGKLKAEVDVRNAKVAGRLVGRINARERVELETGSHLEGDVQSQSFMIQDGVFFQGNCTMGESTPAKKTVPEDDNPDRKPELGILKQP